MPLGRVTSISKQEFIYITRIDQQLCCKATLDKSYPVHCYICKNKYITISFVFKKVLWQNWANTLEQRSADGRYQYQRPTFGMSRRVLHQ